MENNDTTHATEVAWLTGIWETQGKVVVRPRLLVTLNAFNSDIAPMALAIVGFGHTTGRGVEWYGEEAIRFLYLIGPYLHTEHRKGQVRKVVDRYAI